MRYLIIGGLVAFALALAWGFILSGIDMYTDVQCAKLGWPNDKITITASRYCVRRVNQTDVIVSLDSARTLNRR